MTKTNVDAPAVSDLTEPVRVRFQEKLSQSEIREKLEAADPAQAADELALRETTTQSLQQARDALRDALTVDQDHAQIQINSLVRGLGLIRDQCMLNLQAKASGSQQHLLFTAEGVPVIHEQPGNFPFVPGSDTVEVLLKARRPTLLPRQKFDFDVVGL